MKGRSTIGGWNKGLRYGEAVAPEDLKNEPVRIQGKGCSCGTCQLCADRVYTRVWARKRSRPIGQEKSDEELDAKAAKWLEAHR